MGPGVDELDENGVRRLLAYVAAAGIAGGQPVHEVEADTRSVGRYLGCPDVQVQGWPTGVVVSLGGGTPATFESVEGTIRLDQSATTARIRQQLLDGTIGPVEALEQLRDLRSIPPRYPRLGLHGGMVCVASGIALVLQPLWPSVLFSVLAGQVTAGFIWLSGKRKALAVLTPVPGRVCRRTVCLLGRATRTHRGAAAKPAAAHRGAASRCPHRYRGG